MAEFAGQRSSSNKIDDSSRGSLRAPVDTFRLHPYFLGGILDAFAGVFKVALYLLARFRPRLGCKKQSCRGAKRCASQESYPKTG